MGRNTTRILLIISIVIFHFSFFIFHLPKVSAQTFCQPIYGGGQTCITAGNIIINKTVLNPQTNRMVDGLSVNDPKYQPGFITTFQITLTNAGGVSVSKAKVADIFPQYVNFSSGPGSFDSNTKTLSFEIDDLKPNESRTVTIMGRIAEADQIPLDQGVVCVVNQAIAANADNASQISQDNSQLCIEKKALAVQVPAAAQAKGGFPVFPPQIITTTPATGAESLVLFSLVPIGGIGYWLRRKSKLIN